MDAYSGCLHISTSVEEIHTPTLQFKHAAVLVSVRKNYFTERGVKLWNALFREVVESPSLEEFNE